MSWPDTNICCRWWWLVWPDTLIFAAGDWFDPTLIFAAGDADWFDLTLIFAAGDADWFALPPPVLGASWDVQCRGCCTMSTVSVSSVPRLRSQGTGTLRGHTSVSDILSWGQCHKLGCLMHYNALSNLWLSFCEQYYSKSCQWISMKFDTRVLCTVDRQYWWIDWLKLVSHSRKHDSGQSLVSLSLWLSAVCSAMDDVSAYVEWLVHWQQYTDCGWLASSGSYN